MKRMLHLTSAALALTLITIPAWTREGNHGHGAGKMASHIKSSNSSNAVSRSNKGGKIKGFERAEEVQEMNQRADAQRGFTVAPGVEKAETEQAGATVPKSKKGHGRNLNRSEADQRSVS